MSRRQKTPLRSLTPTETQTLTRVSQSRAARLDQVQRARALLAVASGQTFTAAARLAGFRSSEAVSLLVERFNQHGLAVLTIAAGRGRRPTYDAATRTALLARVQQAPDRERDLTATWSLRTLQRSLRQSDPQFSRLGRTTLRRVLQAAGYSHQRTRTWCLTGTVLRKGPTGPRLVHDAWGEEKKGVD